MTEELDISGNFSLWAKRIIIIVNNVKYDLSKEIPDNIWRLGVPDGKEYLLDHPYVNWKIRTELSKEVNKIVAKMLNRDDIRIIL